MAQREKLNPELRMTAVGSRVDFYQGGWQFPEAAERKTVMILYLAAGFMEIILSTINGLNPLQGTAPLYSL